MKALGEIGEEGESWGRFDGLWNGLAIVALALAASFAVNIYRVMSIDGVDITEIFSTIVQGLGLAILSSGVFSSYGKGRVGGFLTSLRIQPRFHGRFIFGFSSALLFTVAAVHSSLDDHYFRAGSALYRKGDLEGAAVAYLQGLQLKPDSPGRRSELGEVYESLGDVAEATKNYREGVEEGDPRSLNNLGRVSLKDKPELAVVYLLLGLQRMEAQQEPDADLQYQLHRNLGWALMRQERAALAESYLLEAIVFDQSAQEKRQGGGMAYCFLAQTYTLGGEPSKAQPLWQSCLESARPEFLHEFQWFIEIGRSDLAYCLDSSEVVGGFEGARRTKPGRRCDDLFSAAIL